MPVEPLITLHDQLWHALEFGFRTPSLVRVGNRLKLGNETGWMKNLMHRAPADYPTVMIEIGRRSAHSAYNHQRTFDRDDPDFTENGGEFPIERIETVDITLKVDKTSIGSIASKAGINNLKEAVQDDLMRSNIRLGLKDLVVRFSDFSSTQRFTRRGEAPYPGQITVISFAVTMQESGRASLLL